MHGRTLKLIDFIDVQRTVGTVPRQLMILARTRPANRVYFASGARLERTLVLKLHSEVLHNVGKILDRLRIVLVARQKILLAASTIHLKTGAPNSHTPT